MKSIIYICPKGKDKPRGGIKIIYKHAEVLSKLLLKKSECKIFHFEDGVYVCKCCKEELFYSNSKYESGCGWPSFDASIPKSIKYEKDTSHGMIRTEILCSKCGSHQGHVFDDGLTKSGKRYCVNSISIDFIPNNSNTK